MLATFIIATVIGGALSGLGAASVLSEQARTLAFVPGSGVGAVVLLVGVLLTLAGVFGLQRASTKRHLPSTIKAPTPLPGVLRPIEWFSLAVSVALAGYGLAGLLPQLRSLLAEPQAWWLHVLLAVTGLASAWRSAKNLRRASLQSRGTPSERAV